MAINSIIVLLIISIASRSFSGFDRLFYLSPVMILLLFICIYRIETNIASLKKMFFIIAAFYAWACITAFWSYSPLFTLTRGFTGYIFVISAVLCGYMWGYKNGVNKYSWLLPLNIIIIISSLFSLISGLPGDAWSGGNGRGFMAFTAHQNTLGALILFTSPAVIYPLLHGYFYDKISIMKYIIIAGLCSANIFFLCLSGSRASILSFCLILIICIYFHFESFSVVKKIVFAGIIILFAAAPFVSNTIYRIAAKKYESIIATRETQLKLSYYAAINGAWAGFGFGLSDQSLAAPAYLIDSDLGFSRREKGNSILGLTEETGIIGLGIFFYLLFYVFSLNIKTLKDRNKYKQALFSLAVLSGFMIHAQAEAWWTGVTSIELFIFFALNGTILKEYADENRN